MAQTDHIIELRDLLFAWKAGLPSVLDMPAFTLARGKSLLIHGPSGCGKSTLLNLFAGVLVPSSGSLRVLGRDLPQLKSAERDALRADQIGFLFQQFNLVPYLSLIDNVTLPCRFSAARRKRALSAGNSLDEVAGRLLTDLGLETDHNRPITALSVGQQQRVAAARALIGGPALVIADEPTSALDPHLRDNFVEQLFASSRAAGSTVILVSHDPELGRHFDEVMDLRDLNRAEEHPCCCWAWSVCARNRGRAS